MRILHRAVVTAITVVSVTTSGTPAYATDTSTTRICGGWTCTVHYSPAATAALDGHLRGARESSSQKAFCQQFGRIGAMTCKALEFDDENVRGIIHDAAATGGCLRFRTPRGASYLPGPAQADHSPICRAMG